MRVALLAAALVLAGCAGVSPAPGALSFDAEEIVRLKTALEGKKPDGTELKEGEPGYISPQDAKARLDKLLSMMAPAAARKRGGTAGSEASSAPEEAALPPILGAGEAVVVGNIRSTSGGPQACRVMVEATGIPLDYWGGGLGAAQNGRFRMTVPAGVVNVRAHFGIFRPVVERALKLGPGRRHQLACTVKKNLPALERIGVRPCRSVFMTSGLGSESGRIWRERIRLLQEVEGVDVLAVSGPEEAVPEGVLRAAEFPPWPGYGRYMVFEAKEKLGPALSRWKAEGGALPCGSFLAREKPPLAACVLEKERFLAPEDVYERWPGLREGFGRTGLFDRSMPSELPFLALSGKVRHVFFEEEDLPGRYLEMLGLCQAIRPLAAPEAWQVWPDVMAPRGMSVLEALRSGRYTIGNGLYVWGRLDGRLPGEPVATGKRRLQVFAFTGTLRDAGIRLLEVYYNGERVQTAKGTHNQVMMTASVDLDLDQPGWLVLYAEGRAREDAQRRQVKTVLKAVSAPFIVGGPAAVITSRLRMSVTDEGGKALGGAKVFASGEVEPETSDASGRAEVTAWWGEWLRIVHGGRVVRVSPWLSESVKEMLRLGQSGEPSVWDARYWRRAEVLLRRPEATVVLPSSETEEAETVRPAEK